MPYISFKNPFHEPINADVLSIAMNEWVLDLPYIFIAFCTHTLLPPPPSRNIYEKGLLSMGVVGLYQRE